MAGNFYESAIDVHVEGPVLHAGLRNINGEVVDAFIDLNEYLGNNNGAFEWGGVDFFQTAQNVEFSFEGGDNVPILRADLQNEEGDFVLADVNLGERIINDNGEFRFQEVSYTYRWVLCPSC
ncbi:Cyanovirin-N [Aspergillus pseudotamarii]|uniref:Cyanovirin-N n=1 Tax=Aspergillus pseudotamarii TaxID=132259 RepID=A0A5N6SGQ8_ASPPS|nr:Cyanovirin-N [Aspergillus pseudotamarii]KAE8133815.1 Cyanovirin-N [Aspergillus pseudotamarii]